MENRINLYNIRTWSLRTRHIQCLRIHPRAIAYVDLASDSFGKRHGTEDRAIKRVNKRLLNERGLNGTDYRPAIRASSRFDDLSDEGWQLFRTCITSLIFASPRETYAPAADTCRSFMRPITMTTLTMTASVSEESIILPRCRSLNNCMTYKKILCD